MGTAPVADKLRRPLVVRFDRHNLVPITDAVPRVPA